MTDEKQTIRLNLADFTIGDLEELEEATGVSLEDVDLDRPPMKVLAFMLYIAGRHDDPSYTLDQARAIKISQLDVSIVNEDGAPDPTAAGSGSDPATPAASSSSEATT